MAKEILILGGARTPMGEYGGGLRDLTANELGAIAARAALERSRIAPDEIDHTVMGNAMQTSADAIYGARHVALKAGVPLERPALTVNRLCGSGMRISEFRKRSTALCLPSARQRTRMVRRYTKA